MSIHDGVVTVADDEIPVIVELNGERIRLSASGREIGDWHNDECQISHLTDVTFAIHAENEVLEFTPNQPNTFAAAVNGGMTLEPRLEPEPGPQPEPGLPQEPELPRESEVRHEPEVERSPDATAASHGAREAPPPKPLTMGLFYALCAATAGLAIWSLINIIF